MKSSTSSCRWILSVCLSLLVAAAWSVAAFGRAAAQSSASAELQALVNLERKALGLKPLLFDARLTSAMEGHVRWMGQTGQLSHIGAAGSSPAQRAMAAGADFGALGETLARGQGTPSEVLLGRSCRLGGCVTTCDSSGRCNGWKQSPAHWGLVVDPRFARVGIACDPLASRGPWWGMLLADAGPFLQSATPRIAAPTATRVPPTATRPLPTAVKPQPTALPVGAAALGGYLILEGRGQCLGSTVLVDGILRTVVGADCSFYVGRLPAGRRRVELRYPGYLGLSGSVDLMDGWTRQLGPQQLRAGDLDGNASVDAADLARWEAASGACRGQSRYSSSADIDASGCVDGTDRGWLAANQGLVGPLPFSAGR